jgi:hypothetical protein
MAMRRQIAAIVGVPGLVVNPEGFIDHGWSKYRDGN